MSEDLPAITPLDALEQQRHGALIVDVRDHDEWDDEHVADAMLVPLDELSARHMEIPRDREIILMCQSGRRSALARDQLAAAHSLRAANLEGGIVAWKKAGLPVVRT